MRKRLRKYPDDIGVFKYMSAYLLYRARSHTLSPIRLSDITAHFRRPVVDIAAPEYADASKYLILRDNGKCKSLLRIGREHG